MALSVKQEKFCIEYAKSGNARQAYKKAGYNCKNDDVTDAAASRLLGQVKVKERLAELADEVKDASIADVTEMQQKLTEIIRQAIEEEVVVVESVGDYMTAARKVSKKPAFNDVIKAINTLGKMQGAFVDNVNLNGAIPVVITGDDALAD